MVWLALLACFVACVIAADVCDSVGNRRGVILCGVALLLICATAFGLFLCRGDPMAEREPTAFDQVGEDYGYLND